MDGAKLMNDTQPLTSTAFVKTGVSGLDSVLRGGLIPNRLYLLEGDPGTGKTTLALQFLMEGVRRGENVLYITLSETCEELETVVISHGWTLKGIDLFELSDTEGMLDFNNEMTLLHPWEVELGETIKSIVKQVEKVNPSRVVFDSLSELRLLAQDSLRYRRQVLALKQYFAGRKCTVFMLDDRTGNDGVSDQQLHSISHGVISLQRLTLEFGAARRRLEVLKLRGLDFRAGWHDLDIRKGGVVVFPRLVASEHHSPFIGEPISSDNPELDSLLHGGPLRGTSTLITGPAGSGKTTLALQYAVAAAKRGEKVVLYEFDERIGTLYTRAAKLGLDLRPFVASGLITIHQVDPGELSPGAFVYLIRDEVENNEVKMVIIDSFNGYITSMPEEKQLLLQIHELLSYMNQKGVVTFLLNPQEGLIGSMHSNMNISYIADTVILHRYFEAGGHIRKALSIIKNRGGGHETTIRELLINKDGLQIGDPLNNFEGILTGTPRYIGANNTLLNVEGK
jgi:circadian clock protein KaiC